MQGFRHVQLGWLVAFYRNKETQTDSQSVTLIWDILDSRTILSFKPLKLIIQIGHLKTSYEPFKPFGLCKVHLLYLMTPHRTTPHHTAPHRTAGMTSTMSGNRIPLSYTQHIYLNFLPFPPAIVFYTTSSDKMCPIVRSASSIQSNT